MGPWLSLSHYSAGRQIAVEGTFLVCKIKPRTRFSPIFSFPLIVSRFSVFHQAAKSMTSKWSKARSGSGGQENSNEAARQGPGQVPGGGNFHNLDNLCISKVCNATSSNEILRFITLSCQLLPLSVFSLFQTYFSKDNTLFYLNLATFNTRPFTLSECCSRKWKWNLHAVCTWRHSWKKVILSPRSVFWGEFSEFSWVFFRVFFWICVEYFSKCWVFFRILLPNWRLKWGPFSHYCSIFPDFKVNFPICPDF